MILIRQQRSTPFNTLGELTARLLLHWQGESSSRTQARSLLSNLRNQATIADESEGSQPAL
jgi:hypothetical protein